MFRTAVLLRSVLILVSFAEADSLGRKDIEFTKAFGCNFDTSTCGFSQDSNDNFNWTRHVGHTSSISTGPSADHTTGSGYYMYIETSSPRQQGDNAKLTSPKLQFGGRMCLKFYYHMYGAGIGTLNVNIDGNKVFSASGDKGNKWLIATIDVNLSGKYAVSFEGIRGSGYQGDIALDDFSLELGSCFSIFGCNFDTSMCGFIQGSNDNFNWTRNKGETWSSYTGPSADHTTGNGYYLYIETSSPRQQGDVAKITSPWLQFYGSMCLKFYYHMYGADIGTLKVNLNGISADVFTASGDKGNKWLIATIDVKVSGVYAVTFEGIRGSDYEGDIAIDDFVLESGSCSSNSRLACSPTEIINFSDEFVQRLKAMFLVGRDHILAVRRAARWLFNYCDSDGNALLEMGDFLWCFRLTILHRLLRFYGPNCPYGFVKSCDNDGNLGISRQEWLTCLKIEEGQWRWSPWSDCSVTCGDGQQRRTGTCISPSTGRKLKRQLCDGDDNETRNCTNGECPEGKWSRWSPWTDCSRSCGKGGQSRSRTCRNKVTGKALKNGWCAGKPQQEKTCADWKCPDGRKSICPAYEERPLKGRVLSFGDAPLAGANISLAESPYLILSRSQDNGFFVVDVFCFDKEKPILITRHGYVPQVVDVTPSRSVLKVKMENAVHPTVKTHPEDRRRFVGQDVTFCCQVEGNPPPVIEWFRNENILDQDEFNYNETLVIRKVGKNMAGEIRCRAVNEFGAEFSNAAVLEVLDRAVDTCNSALSDHFVTLPDDCSEDRTGKKKINIQKCKAQPCLRADTLFPESCDEAERCCQAGTVTETTIRCGQEKFKMDRVLNCICDVCNEKTTIVKGVVVGGPDQSLVEYCDILINDTVVSYSDFDGTFEIPVPKSAKRLVATFRDYMEEYAESTVVLHFRKGTTTFHKVHLRPEVPPIEFDPEVEKTVPIANDDVAQVIIPANSLIDKDGNPKKGKAKVKIQFNDPRNERDILEAPGEFSTVDEDGEEQLLRTYGIFKIKVQDENNQNLGLTKNLHINIDLEQLTREKFDESEHFPHLWWLNEKTGRWVDAGELKRNQELTQRPKRQTQRSRFSGNIQPGNLQRPLNIDKTEQRCFAKVKAEVDGKGIENAKVTSTFKNRQNPVFQGYRTKYTDSDGYACISTHCNCDGYLQVEKNGSPLLPQEKSLPKEANPSIVNIEGNGRIAIKFNPGAQCNNGPVYRSDEKRSCMRNSAGQSIFLFHSKVKKQETFKPAYKPASLKYKADYEQIARFKRCFIRVVHTGTKRIVIKAVGYLAPDKKIQLGEQIKFTEAVKNTNLFAACLEHSCPKSGGTFVHIKAVSGRCQRDHVQSVLEEGESKDLARDEAIVSIPPKNHLSGVSLGLWKWAKDDGDAKIFETKCVNGKSISYSRPDREGFVARFNCYN